jgi:hypothetical protein
MSNFTASGHGQKTRSARHFSKLALACCKLGNVFRAFGEVLLHRRTDDFETSEVKKTKMSYLKSHIFAELLKRASTVQWTGKSNAWKNN